MMYIDAVTRGLDAIPDIRHEVRAAVLDDLEHQGLTALLEELKQRDPDYYAIVDKANPRRVVHAVEVCRQTGGTYSALRRGVPAERAFDVVKYALNVPREILFDRINRRVLDMMNAGLDREAQSMSVHRHLQALNTVGMKEMFAMFDGVWNRDTAIARLQKNTRVYAKKQLTWLHRDESITWLAPDIAVEEIVSRIERE